MNEIKCPNCGKIFQIDKDDYDSIVKQIHNDEFEEELARREKELDLKNSMSLITKDKEIDKLKNDLDKKELEVSKKFDKELVEKDKEIQQLKNDLKQKENEYIWRVSK